ncbi:MAG TPA: FtsX-like permease family protein [Symbiobacteriaceae bacterium]|jgi:putative ABC transport system permease protein
MNFYFRTALREFRRGRRRFVFFLLCIAIGVAGLTGIKGFNASLQGALLREARTLMAADLQLSTGRTATPAQAELLAGLPARGIAVAHNVETASMAVNPATRDTTLVEVKAVGPGYPFYGALAVNPPAPLTDETALVGPELLDRLGLKVGDTVKLGSTTFVIGGVIVQEPDRITAGFAMGPRVMITPAGLARANLIQFGSRAQNIYLFKLADPKQVGALRSELTTAFAKERPRIADYREANPTVRRFLDRLTAFLSLVSLVALLVGGLGVANATRVFIQEKLDAIAVMKCLGATNRKVTGVYLTQMLMLGLAGSALGVAAGYGVQLFLPKLAGTFLNLTLTPYLSPEVALQGLLVGVLTAFLFTLLPLTAIADVKPALVFRRAMGEARLDRRTTVREGLLLTVTGLGIALISTWVSGSVKWGFAFVGGLGAATLLLGGAARVAVGIVKRIRVPRSWPAARQGLANLHRPGSQASAVVLALGVGVTLVLTIFLLQRGLLREVRLTSPAGAPNMFFMGLQQADEPAFKAFLRSQPGVLNAPDPIPFVRGKLVKVNGKSMEELTLAENDQRWFNSMQTLSYSATLPSGNELLRGRWWTPADYQDKLVISVESEAATRLHLDVGMTMDLELEGSIPAHAEIMNIRKTTDYRAGGAFNFVLGPSELGPVPVSFIGQANVAQGAAGPLQREMAAQFPGVTAIDLNDILKTVGTVLDRIGLVIRFVAGFSVAAGLIILASSIAATKFRRTREAVLYKTLGATRSRVWRMFAVEYATIGLVAGIVGAGLAAGVTWALLRFVMESTYHFELLPLLAGIGVTIVLTVAVGVLSTVDVVSAKPYQVLREE